MLYQSFLVVIFAITSTLARRCDASDKKYAGRTAALIQEVQHSPLDVNHKLSVSGVVRVIDGCSFAIDNFTFLPGFDSTYWYGRVSSDTVHAMKMSDELVNAANNETNVFSLTTVPGAEMSWDDINTLVLFSSSENFEIAKAELTFISPTVSTANPSATDNPTGISASSSASATTYPLTWLRWSVYIGLVVVYTV